MTDTTVTFENAALASAIARCARVAPTKGAAFDKASGIVFSIRPNDTEEAVDLRATNLEVDIREAVDALSIDADASLASVQWRLPAPLLAGLIGGLPIGTGKTVTFRQERNTIHITSDKMKASLQILPADDFPTWDNFDPDGLESVHGFTGKIGSVSWACAKDSIPLSGVRVTGTHLIATDRYRLAKIPCTVPIEDPITVPLDVLTPILKSVDDAKIKATGHHLLLMPDPYTQLRAILYDADYPQVERVMAQDKDLDSKVTVNRELLRSAIQRIMVVTARGDRYPLIRLTFTPDAIGLYTKAESIGDVEDEIDCTPVTTTVEEFVVYFTPNFLTDALGGTIAPDITIEFVSSSGKRMVKFSDGAGYEAWVMPRKPETAV